MGFYREFSIENIERIGDEDLEVKDKSREVIVIGDWVEMRDDNWRF